MAISPTTATAPQLQTELLDKDALQVQESESKEVKEKTMKIMERVIRLIAAFQDHLSDISKEINKEKTEATKLMLTHFNEQAKWFHWQAGVGTFISFAGSAATPWILGGNEKQITWVTALTPMVKEAITNPLEGWKKSSEGIARKFEALGQEFKDLASQTSQASDAMGDKLQAAIRSKAPGSV